MLLGIVVTLLIILIAVIAILSVGINKVNQYERGIVEKWNAYEKTVDPGLHYILPIRKRMLRVNMR